MLFTRMNFPRSPRVEDIILFTILVVPVIVASQVAGYMIYDFLLAILVLLEVGLMIFTGVPPEEAHGVVSIRLSS